MAEIAAGRECRADAASRLELARGVLRGLEDRAAGVRPVVGAGPVEAGADGRVLPVAAPLARLLPSGGLRRGTSVAVLGGPGATSLLLGLIAEASADGAWVGVVGRPELGLVAAAEAGVRLERLALVPHPGRDLLAVTVALLDGMDVVAVPGAGVRAGDRQRLAARARQRGAVLLALGPWPGAEVQLSCTSARWQGLGTGSGRLRARRVRVESRGKGLGPGRDGRLLLPAAGRAVGGAPEVVVPGLVAAVAG